MLIFLGKNDEYLGYKTFQYLHKAELFIDKCENLILANIERTMPLKERLSLAPEYFPFAGRLEDIEFVDLTLQEEK